MTDDLEIVRLIPRWFIMFEGPERRRFIVDWFTTPGFRHCLAFGFDADADRWLIYDVTRVGTVIIGLTQDQFPDWLAMMKERGASVLQVDLPEKPRDRSWLQTGMWCVTAVIHLTGVRSGAWRPIALWRDLKRAGATEAFDGLAETA